MIDLGKPIRIQDDRSKIDDVLVVVQVLWRGTEHALVRVRIEEAVRDPERDHFGLDGPPEEPFLLDLRDGHVLNADFQFWIARNDDPLVMTA